jgi:hypothetical protein
MSPRLISGSLFLLLAPACAAAAEDWSRIEVPTLDGTVLRPAAPNGAPFAVLVFIATDCPVANAHQPELRRLEARARELGGKFTLVHADPSVPMADLKAHADAYAIAAPVALDHAQSLARAIGITVTPEAAVIDRTGSLAYRGRISDLYAAYGSRRPAPTVHDLREAMEALASGRPVPVPRTEALGCFLPDPP